MGSITKLGDPCQVKSHNPWPNKDLTPGTNQPPCGRCRGVYLIGKPMTTQHMVISRRLFLLKSGALSISQGRNKIFSPPTPMIFSNMNMNCTWSNQWRNHNARSLLPTTPRTANLSLNLDDGLLFLEILDYATSAPTMQLKMRHILCWDVPYATPLLETSLHHYLKKLLEVTAFNVGHTDCFLRKLTWVIVLFCATIVLWIIFNVWVGSLREDPGS